MKKQILIKKIQRGFTLIELAIVGLFLGLLAIFAITQFSGSATDTTKANGIYEASNKISENWSLVTMQCGTPADITLSPIGGTPVSAAKNLSVLLGTATPNATYSGCVTQSGVKTLNGLSQGSAGTETVQSYPLTVTKGAVDREVLVTFSNVPDNVVLPLYNKYSSVSGAKDAATVPATADTSDPAIRFGAISGGVRTLTIVKRF